MNATDNRVIANLAREAQLKASHRDLTKPVPPVGSTPESIRQVPGFENITDEMLDERATFNLKDHMAGRRPVPAVQAGNSVDLTHMTSEELRGLAAAAEQQAAIKENK